MADIQHNYKAIVAYEKNRGIAKGLDIPWHISEDFKRFKKLTLNQTVIMGRNTFQGILNTLGKPLPKRNNIIISTTLDKLEYENCKLYHNLDNLLNEIEEAWVIGAYKTFLPYVKEIFATEIAQEYDCDTFFPKIVSSEWQITSVEEKEGFKFVNYLKK